MFVKKILMAGLFCALALPALAQQSTFEPGWFVMEPSAKYYIIKGADTKKARLKAGQCLVAFEMDNGIYMCSDGNGRVIAVSGANALTELNDAGRTGILISDVKAGNGGLLRKGALYWILSVDEAGGMYTVRSAGGKTEKIPLKAMQPYSTYLSQQQRGKDYKDSE